LRSKQILYNGAFFELDGQKNKWFFVYLVSLVLILLIALIIIIFGINCDTGVCNGPGLAILIVTLILGVAIIYSLVYWILIKYFKRPK